MTQSRDQHATHSLLEQLRQCRGRLDELEVIEAAHLKVLEDLNQHQEELRAQNEELRQAQAALDAASRRYHDLFDFAPVAYFLLDQSGAIAEANFTACELLGEPRGVLLRRPMRLYVPAEFRPAFERYLAQAAATRRAGGLEAAIVGHGGTVIPMQFSLAVDEAGGRPRHRLAAVDMSGRQQAEAQRRLAAVMFEESNEGMMVTDPEGRIQRVNRAFSVVTGYAEPEVVGKKPSILASGRHDAGFYQAMWERLTGVGNWMGEIWNRRKNGEVYPEWLKIGTVRGPDGRIRHFVGIFSDIGDHKRTGQEIERFAFYDTLTDLPNRALFSERLKHALIRAHRDGRPVVLLYLDLDRFKSINDTLGHQSGDLLLQQVATRLRQVVRAHDTVARLGGDEFTVMLADMEDLGAAGETARRVAEEIREHLARPFFLGGREVGSGASIGIAMYPRDGDTFSDLVRHADIAMYQAKRDGGNGHAFFSPEMNAQVARRATLEGTLREAVRRGGLALAYQPVVDAARCRVVGVEALLRWAGPDGPVPPQEFIPVLEELGLGHEVARWVIASASREVAGWDMNGAAPWLSVNLSPRQLHRAAGGWLGDALEAGGLPPERLVVEVTEDFFQHHNETIVPCLAGLRRLGARVALDDFGTGHSSLGRLRHLPIDMIKIDRGFVRGLPDERKDLAIVDTIITLARHLGLDILAEGVESEGQLDLLRRSGCGLMQGYLYAPPMPGEACRAWCAEFNGRTRKQ